MSGVFVLLLFLWVFGDGLAHIDSTTTALVGLGVLLICGVLTWKDVLAEEGAWDTLIWFAAYGNLSQQPGIDSLVCEDDRRTGQQC
jgi:DASS family divalent anion:Na+ symporter